MVFKVSIFTANDEQMDEVVAEFGSRGCICTRYGNLFRGMACVNQDAVDSLIELLCNYSNFELVISKDDMLEGGGPNG